MSAIRTKDDVEQYSGRPAVNVKVYKNVHDVKLPDTAEFNVHLTHEWIERHVSDEYMDGLFWLICEDEFEQVQQDAADIFGAGVTVERAGRSGGWAVVHGLEDVEDWDAVMLAKWRKFAKYARAIADDVPYQLIASIACNEFEAWVSA